MTAPVLNRVVRRETHSPRTVAAVLVLLVAVVALAYLGVELVLGLLGLAPLLVSPEAGLEWLAGLPQAEPQATIAAVAVLVGLVGLVLVVLALTPGRRPKHRLAVTEHAVLADNGVIATSLAERVRREFDLAKGGVTVGVAHRSADLTVQPEPGQVLDRDQLRAVAEQELSGYALEPQLRVLVRVRQPRETGAES
jgi:hypothetical protein